MPTAVSVDHILHSGFIGQGEYVDEFENKFALKFDISPEKVVSLNSCTSAIQLALRLIGLDEEDEIVTTPYTMIATNTNFGKSKLVWYDVNPISGLADLENIKKVITKKTKAVIVVHIAGTMTNDLELILDYCHNRGIIVIEDAAQSLGAKFNNQYISEKSDFVTFSFQAIKHLTTIDGGMLYCRNMEDAQRGKKLRWFGYDRTYDHQSRSKQDITEIGYKIHMTDVNAYIGIKGLESIDGIIKQHQNNAKLYQDALKDTCRTCHTFESGSSFWTYPVHVVGNRDELINRFNLNGVQTSIVHNRLDTMTCFKQYVTELPNLDYFMERILHLPCGWWVSERDIQNITSLIREWSLPCR
jgi:dTDP-4-amino-4,6-dideoxygalactose transaminase